MFKDLISNPQGTNHAPMGQLDEVYYEHEVEYQDRLQALQQGLKQSEKEGFERLRKALPATSAGLKTQWSFPSSANSCKTNPNAYAGVLHVFVLHSTVTGLL